MDLALLFVLAGVLVVLLTVYNTVGIALVLVGVVLVVYFAFSGRGTLYRGRRR